MSKPSKEELEQLHETMGLVAMARHFHVRDTQIKAWFREYDIKQKDMRRLGRNRRKDRPDPNTLRRWHHVEERTVKAMADEVDVSPAAMKKWLEDAGIEIRYHQHSICPVPASVLRHHHHEEEMTIESLARKFNVSNTSIRRWLSRESIEIRTCQPHPVPSDLTDRVHTATLTELSIHYQVSVSVLYRWFRKIGIDYVSKRSPQRPERDTLIRLHHIERRGLRAIAEEFGTSFVVVKQWFKDYQIEQFIFKQTVQPSRDELVHLHHVKRKNLVDIGALFGVTNNAVRMWFVKEGIEVLDLSREHIPPREDLVHLHIKEELPATAIARQYDVSGSAVLKWLKSYDIEVQRFESFPERQITELLISNNVVFQRNDRTVLDGLELDFFIPERKLAIEYCGLYWHSDHFERDPSYHYNKLELCSRRGIQLITIFEDEWVSNENVCRSLILSKLGRFESRIMARDCELIRPERSDVQKFLTENHLQRTIGNVSEFVALVFQDGIVGAAAVGKHHYGGVDKRVLNRLCFKKNHQVVGGGQRLIKALGGPLITWSDNRWSTGTFYERMGFELDDELAPSYSYCRGTKRISPKSLRHHLPKEKPDVLTEAEWAAQHGWYRIWDCGKKRWYLE